MLSELSCKVGFESVGLESAGLFGAFFRRLAAETTLNPVKR
jgi:hypothetical protein